VLNNSTTKQTEQIITWSPQEENGILCNKDKLEHK